MKHFEYNLGEQKKANDDQEVTCKISLACSDDSNEKAAAKILLNFQQIAQNRGDMLKTGYNEPNWSYIAHQSTAVYRINRAYAPMSAIQANTWKIDGGLTEKTEEEIRAAENNWHKESNRTNPFEDCTPVPVYPSFPITTLADWARENNMKPRPKYSQEKVKHDKPPDEQSQKTEENPDEPNSWFQYKCTFV